MKNKSSISKIIYRKLLYKNITTVIITAIVLFIVIISLFILYQIKVANFLSKQIEIDLNNLVLNANITKNYIQKKYNSVDKIKDNIAELTSDIETILLNQELTAVGGFQMLEPPFLINMHKKTDGWNGSSTVNPKIQIQPLSHPEQQYKWWRLLSRPELKDGVWESPVYGRPSIMADFPIFNEDESKIIGTLWFNYDNVKFFENIYSSAKKTNLINKYFLEKKAEIGEKKYDLKGNFIIFSGKPTDKKYTKKLAQEVLNYKKDKNNQWSFSNGYLYYLNSIKVKNALNEFSKQYYATILYQIDLKALIAIVLNIEVIIFIVLAIFGFLSIKNIKNHITRLLKPLKVITKKTQEISNGNFDIQIKEKSEGYDINLLTASINNMCQNIKRLTKKEKENIKTQAEIKLAQQIQSSFVQKGKEHIKIQLDKNNLLEIHAKFLAGNLISGDIYDITKDTNKVNIFIGDTVGKDMAAAVFSLIVMSQYKAIQKNNSPKNIAKEINHFIFEQNRQNMFISAIFCSIDLEKLTLTISNAGNPNPIVINNNAKEAEIFDLKSNPALGIKKKNKYQQNVIRLNENTEVILYTGGVNESFDKDSKIYGVKGLINTICEFKKSKKSKKSNLLEHIQSDIANFTTKLGNKNKLDDDLTIMHIKLNSTS